MNIKSDVNVSYNELAQRGTAGSSHTTDYKLIDFPIGKYIIRVAVTPSNEFIAVVEVSVNQDFRSFQEKLAGAGFHEVEQFYRDK